MAFAVHTRLASHPSLAIGYLVLACAFALTASLLSLNHLQRGNSLLFGGVTLTFILDQTTWLPIGRWALIGVVAAEFTPVLVAAVLLRYPSARLDRVGRWFVGLNLVAAGVVGLAVAATYPNWVGGVWSPGHAFRAAIIGRKTWMGVAAMVCLVLLGRRYVRLSRFDRTILRPVIVTGAAEVALVGLLGLQPWISDSTETVLSYLRTWGAVAVSLSILVSAVLLLRSLSRVGRLASELTTMVTLSGLEDALRRALDDSALTVHYWLPDRQVLVDRDGHESRIDQPVPPRRHRVQVTEGQHDLLAVLTVDEALAHQTPLVENVAAVSRLALRSARLEADLRFQLRETADARARLLQSTFEERRRLELDLHDGVQQRLVAVAMLLAVAQRSLTPEDANALGPVRDELAHALQDLRNLAHGIYPEVLSRAGVAAALEQVAGRLPIRVELAVERRRWASPVEGAVYFATSEALTNVCKHAAAESVWVLIEQREEHIDVVVRDDGHGTAFLPNPSSLRDRVAALGGHLQVRSGTTGTTVAFDIPATLPPRAG